MSHHQRKKARAMVASLNPGMAAHMGAPMSQTLARGSDVPPPGDSGPQPMQGNLPDDPGTAGLSNYCRGGMVK